MRAAANDAVGAYQMDIMPEDINVEDSVMVARVDNYIYRLEKNNIIG